MKDIGHDSGPLRGAWRWCVLTVLAMVWLPTACSSESNSRRASSIPTSPSGGIWGELRVVGPALVTPDATLHDAVDLDLQAEREQLSTCLEESGFSAGGLTTTDAQALLTANMARPGYETDARESGLNIVAGQAAQKELFSSSDADEGPEAQQDVDAALAAMDRCSSQTARSHRTAGMLQLLDSYRTEALGAQQIHGAVTAWSDCMAESDRLLFGAAVGV